MQRKPFNVDLAPFRDDLDLKYAAKHKEESNICLIGDVWTDHWRNGRIIHGPGFYQGNNIFTTEGRNQILDIVFGSTSVDATIYMGIFTNNVTPAAADTASAKLGASGDYGEGQDADYDDPETNRPEYTVAAASSSSVTNSASKAEFTIADTITVYGAFLASTQAKTATSGVLYCAKAFSSSRSVIDDDVLAITYAISMTSS